MRIRHVIIDFDRNRHRDGRNDLTQSEFEREFAACCGSYRFGLVEIENDRKAGVKCFHWHMYSTEGGE